MPRSEGISNAHKVGSLRFVATLAGVDLDHRLCLVVAAAISLALIGGSQLELLVAALALLRTVWVRSRTGSPTPSATPRKCVEGQPQQEPKVSLAQHRCGGDMRSPQACDATAVVESYSRPLLPRVRGRDLRLETNLPAAKRPALKKYVDLIMAHAHAKQLPKALEVLTEMRQLFIEPNVACFTALISACDKGKQPEKALELFDTMQKEGVEPTVVTYNALISACSNGQMPERAMEKCAEMQERGLTPNVVTYTSLIRAYGQSHHPESAWDVFDTMTEAGVTPNVITYSSLIQAAQSCQDPEKGLRIFAEMERAGIAPSLFAYNNLKSCWRNLPLSRALKATRIMQDEGEPPSKSAWLAVKSVCFQDKLEKDEVPSTTAACNARTPERLNMLLETLRKGPKPDVASYAAVIGAYEKSRMSERGLRLFQEMLDEGVSPDITVCNCAIRCCEQLGDAEKAAEVFEKMNQHQVSPDVDTFATLISVGGKGCTIALDHFKEMQDKGLTPTCHVYNTAISACSHLKRKNGKNGVCIGLALDLFRSMKEAKVVPDAFTYNALFTACEKRVWPLRAEELFREMEANGPEPDVIAYNGLISCWANSRKVERAMQLLEEMQSKGVAPNAATYSTLVQACEKAGDFAKMREVKEMEARRAR